MFLIMYCPNCDFELLEEDHILDFSNENGEHRQTSQKYLTCPNCNRTYEKYDHQLILI